MRHSSSFRKQLRDHLFQSLGFVSAITLVGCGSTVQEGNGNGGDGGEGGKGSTTSDTSSSTTKTSSTVDTGSTTSSSSTDTNSTSTTDTNSTSSSTTTTTPMGVEIETCFTVTPGVTCATLAEAPGYFGPCTELSELIVEWVSGPSIKDGSCCYQVKVNEPGTPDCAVIGRPLVVGGRAVAASLTTGANGWQGRSAMSMPGSASSPRNQERTYGERADKRASVAGPNVEGLAPALREKLALAWGHDALFEHASVASFGKLALELLAFGAPSDLIRAAHEAALDEVGHAELGFALASAYVGHPVGPGPLSDARGLSLAGSLPELAVAALVEGCFGETMAAVVAAAQRDAATDSAAKAALSIISEEESRHAELAFRVVAWAIQVGGSEVMVALQKAYHEQVATLRNLAEVKDTAQLASEASHLREHGLLPSREVAEEQRRALEEVVVPTLSALLSTSVAREAVLNLSGL